MKTPSLMYLTLLEQGMTVQLIADSFGLSPRTISRKLDESFPDHMRFRETVKSDARDRLADIILGEREARHTLAELSGWHQISITTVHRLEMHARANRKAKNEVD